LTLNGRPARPRTLNRWLPVVAWMAFVFVLSAQPDLPHPKSGWADLLLSIVAHVGLYAVLAWLWMRALGGQPRVWLLALLFSGLYALSDELHQAFVPGRHADPWDLLADAAGAVLGLLSTAWCRARAHRRERR